MNKPHHQTVEYYDSRVWLDYILSVKFNDISYPDFIRSLKAVAVRYESPYPKHPTLNRREYITYSFNGHLKECFTEINMVDRRSWYNDIVDNPTPYLTKKP